MASAVPPPAPDDSSSGDGGDGDDTSLRLRPTERMLAEMMAIHDMNRGAAKRYLARQGKATAERAIRQHWREWRGGRDA